jgi:hypothetical protein
MPESEKGAEDLKAEVLDLARLVVDCCKAGGIIAVGEAARHLDKLKVATEALRENEVEDSASRSVQNSHPGETYVVPAPVRVSKCEWHDCERWATWRAIYPRGCYCRMGVPLH